MPRLFLLDMLLDTPDRHAVVLFQPHGRCLDDVGFREFACGVVGDGDDADVCDGRVGEEVGFELGGGDLEPLDRLDQHMLYMLGRRKVLGAIP